MMRISDVIEDIAECNAMYLCHYLTGTETNHPDATKHYGTVGLTASRMIANWVRTVNRDTSYGSPALVSVYEMYVRQDTGQNEWIDISKPKWHKIRAQWCRDYAAFLREFGL
jgi:hypothetical protein